MKYDVNGNVLWAKSAGGNGSDNALSISIDASGNALITGYFQGSTITFETTTLTNVMTNGSSDIFVAKLVDQGTDIQITSSNQTVSIFPNPFSSQTVLQTVNSFHNATLTVYNSFGQIVKEITPITIGAGQPVTLFRDNLPSGLFFIRLTVGNKIITTAKIVITN